MYCRNYTNESTAKTKKNENSNNARLTSDSKAKACFVAY